ncbi:MAG TPA: LamG-like jellyroll fold domain-containing protein, partial [Vicinamibacterales bacterium]|nr:LamG-like jellyroll fold domain-containing protein [Vicinamibacterales bacterium]
DGWAKAGVMIRQDLTGGAPNAMSAVTAANGMSFQQRVIQGGTSTFNNQGFSGVAPTWVRLDRSGNTFTGYYSATGSTWILMGSVTVPMTAQAYVGLAVTSHNASALTTATLSNVTVTVGTPAPSVTSLTPSSGTEGTSVTIAGTNFGATQDTSTVTFNGTAATPTSWSATSISAPVPTAATTGNVVVTVGGQVSNGMSFTVTVVVTATWNANAESDIAGYVLSYGTQSGVYSTSVDVGNVTGWQGAVTSGVRYYFAVKAYNTSLQYSPYSPEVVFDVPTGSAMPSVTVSANQTSAAKPAVSLSVAASNTVVAPAPIIDPALAAFWPLDDGVGTTAFDASGGGRNGTLLSGNRWTTGRLGGALSFDGHRDHVTTTFVESLSAWTVAAWVWSPAAPSSTFRSGPVDRGKNFQINWDAPDAAFRGAVAMSADGMWYGASFGKLEANRWYYLVGSYDGAFLCAYVNGMLATANPVYGKPDLESLPLTIGTAAGASSYFAGVVSGVRIYRRAISAADVAALARPDATPPTAVTLSATAAGQVVSLNWTAAADPNSGVSHYRIYRGTTAGGTKVPLAEGLPTALTYHDRLGARFSTYYYEVSAVNGDGVEGPRSNEASVVTGATAAEGAR